MENSQNNSRAQNEQVRVLKGISFFVKLITVFTGAIFGCLLYLMLVFVPKINNTIDSLESSAKNLEEISVELQDADLGGMVKDIDKLINTSETTIGTANDKLNQIDFDTLNKSINDLSRIIAPLSGLFGGRQ